MKRKYIHRPEETNLSIFKDINPADFPSRKEAYEYRDRQKRVAYYLIGLSIIVIIVSSIIIYSILSQLVKPQTEPEVSGEPYTEITVTNTEIETIKTKLNFGAPNPPGDVAENEPAIIEYFKTPETPILIKTEITSIVEATTEQTYFINEILSTYGEIDAETPEQKYWLTTITSQANKDEWNEDIDLTKHIIPKSTPSNMVEEILITNWKDCTTNSVEKRIDKAEIVETTYCLVFATSPEQQPSGIKYVGQDIMTPNEYSVYNGDPITIQITP